MSDWLNFPPGSKTSKCAAREPKPAETSRNRDTFRFHSILKLFIHQFSITVYPPLGVNRACQSYLRANVGYTHEFGIKPATLLQRYVASSHL